MFQRKYISLVFPAYNEEAGIEKAIDEFSRLKLFDEIIVVDNNSHDKTAQLARAKGVKMVTEKKQGYGYALRRGMQSAKGDFVVLCEPDGTFSASDTKKLLSLLSQYDMVLGTRTDKRLLHHNAHMTSFLRLGNIAVAKFLQVLFKTPNLSDCGCTFRALKKDVAKMVYQEATVGSSHFLPEMVMLAKLHNYTMKEVPVVYQQRIGISKITGSFIKSVQVGTNMVRLILSYRLKK